jgi:hypothetical protein
VNVEPAHLRLVAGRLRALSKRATRRARREGECIYVEGGRGKQRIEYVRLRRVDDTHWVVEELGGASATLRWVRRSAKTTLEDVLSRWDSPDVLWSDLRLGSTFAPEEPDETPPTTADRAAMRAELTNLLTKHESWLIEQLRTRLSYQPSLKLRRIQLEWNVGAIHDGLSLGGSATDAEGEEANEAAPGLPFRKLWSREIGSRIGSYKGGWYEAAVECVEKWILACYKRAAPKPPCPVYLSRHDGLGTGINLATGRRTTFRED